MCVVSLRLGTQRMKYPQSCSVSENMAACAASRFNSNCVLARIRRNGTIQRVKWPELPAELSLRCVVSRDAPIAVLRGRESGSWATDNLALVRVIYYQFGLSGPSLVRDMMLSFRQHGTKG